MVVYIDKELGSISTNVSTMVENRSVATTLIPMLCRLCMHCEPEDDQAVFLKPLSPCKVEKRAGVMEGVSSTSTDRITKQVSLQCHAFDLRR
jgi:hypothetical protein